MNRALPDADLDAFVEALATRIAGFDKWAIANTKRLVNTSLPPDVELGAGWDACIASLGRPAAQDGISLMARGFHKPGDAETGSDTTWRNRSLGLRSKPSACQDSEGKFGNGKTSVGWESPIERSHE